MGADSSWPDARPALAPYRFPSRGKAVWQLINTLVPYAGLWYLMILSIRHDFSYLWTLALAVVAAAFLVRLFMIFHDCVHGSFLPSKRANIWTGRLLGVAVFTAFDDWRLSHLRHHVSYANLDSRGFGDIWTLTCANIPNRPGSSAGATGFTAIPWCSWGSVPFSISCFGTGCRGEKCRKSNE